MRLMYLIVHGALVIVLRFLTQSQMPNPTGMNLLECTEWKVFFFSQAPKGEGVGGKGWSQSGGAQAKTAQKKG